MPEPFEKERQLQEHANWQESIPAPVMPSEQKKEPPLPEASASQPSKIDFSQMNLLKEEAEKENTPAFRIIGQVFDTYWLIEYESELLIIDQHDGKFTGKRRTLPEPISPNRGDVIRKGNRNAVKNGRCLYPDRIPV